MFSKFAWTSTRFLTALSVGVIASSVAMGATIGRFSEDPVLTVAPTAVSVVHVDPAPAQSTPNATQEAALRVAAKKAAAEAARKKAAAKKAAQRAAAQRAAAKKAAAKQAAAAAKKKAAAEKARKTAAAKAPTSGTKSAPKSGSRNVAGPTNWGALNAAIARIPGYYPGAARWTVTSRYGHWGTTDLANGNIYISPNAPSGRLDSIARHEYAHVLTVRAYGGQWRTAKQAMNAHFGGSGMTGVERAADCMALQMGAGWTNYTSCSSSTWRKYANRLLAGQRL